MKAFSYPDDAAENVALTDINFTVKAGETVGIVGRVGSGKTTLLKLLLRQFDGYTGTIKVGGVDIKAYTFAAYLRAIGYVAQENFLFSTTIRDNIRFANIDEAQAVVEEAAKESGLS